MASVGFDLAKLEAEKKLVIIDASLSGMAFKPDNPAYTISPEEFSLDSIVAIIHEAVNDIGAKRAVVDSFSALDSLIETKKSHVGMGLKEDVRRAILGINYKLQSMNLTSMLISDIVDEGKLSTHGIEEFMVDGVIKLDYKPSGPTGGRHLVVNKMRSTSHSENIHTIELIEGKGMCVMDLSV